MSMPGIYQDCLAGSETNQLLQCVADALEEANQSVGKSLDVFFLLYSSALVFFMQAGFAMLCAGSVRQKNVQNTMLKNILDACSGALSFWAVGYAFAYGGSNYESNDNKVTFIGGENFFLDGLDTNETVFWLFQFAFAATSATIVAGTLAERCQMVGYLLYSSLLTGFIYPVVVHSTWSGVGFLSFTIENPLFDTGFVDFAGSGVVHVTGGMAAILASIILGPRKGRFHDERTGEVLGEPKKIEGHSPSLQVLGTFILWFCWYGFNPGSTQTVFQHGNIASIAAATTTLAAAAGGISALCLEVIYIERKTGEATFNLTTALNGCLSGLVAITGACAYVDLWASVLIGTLSGFVYLASSYGMEKFHIDDAVDAIPVHLCSGMLGVVCVGLFATKANLQEIYGPDFDHEGLVYDFSDWNLLGSQLVGLLFIIGWVTGIMTPFFLTLNYLGWFRADPLEEVIGLDISYHGRSAYDQGEIPRLEFTNFSKAKGKKSERLQEIIRKSSMSARENMGGTEDDNVFNGNDDNIEESNGMPYGISEDEFELSR